MSVSEKNLQHEAFTKKRQYLDSYKDRRRDMIKSQLSAIEYPKGSLLEKCRKYFEPLLKSSPYFKEKIGGKLLLEVMNGTKEDIIVDFSATDESPIKLFNDDKFFYKFQIDSRFLNLILEKKLTWEQLFLSLRFKASRNPDEFNALLFTFLRFADPASYRAYEIYETQKNMNETFLLENGDKKYEVQKYCPHAMGNLSKGRIVDGCIVCPNHGWAFSLEDGSCLYNKSSIKIRRVT